MSDLLATLSKAARTDPAGTAVLIDFAMCDWMYQEMTEAREALTKAALPKAVENVAKAKVALVKTYVAKSVSGEYPDADHLTMAQYLIGLEHFLDDIAKADWETWNFDAGQKRRQVNRDTSGRFQSISASRPVAGTNKDAFKMGRLGPVHERTRVEGDEIRLNTDVPPEESVIIDRFQGAYEASVKTAHQAQQQLGDGAKDATVMLTLGDGTQTEVLLDALANPEKGDNLRYLNTKFAGLGQHITGMQVRPSAAATTAQRQQMAQFNGMGLLDQYEHALRGNSAGVKQLFTPRTPGARDSRLNASMGRIGVAGSVLEMTDPTGKIGILARYIGTYGPEASRVLGPHVRRGAYRYRGTERTANPEITGQIEGDWGATLDSLAASIDQKENSAGQASSAIKPPYDGAGKKTGHNMPMLQSIRWRGRLAPETSGDSLKMGVRSDVAAAELLKTLPSDALLGEVARLSGRGLPSQGVIIDKDGDVVSQSVGFANDHYVPFNLANIGRLRGGQYVRTRQQGGLTGEDVYTTIMSGARSATVASSSGVFRLEMSPDFRGARANSDKAASMYDSYLNILHTIDTAGLYNKGLEPEVMAEIEEKAINTYKDPKSKEHQDFKAKLVAEATRKATTVTAEERSEIKVKALEQGEGDEAAARQIEAALLHDKRAEKMSEVNLNGEGYNVALQTLQQQYPYFIKSVEYAPLRGNPRIESDDKAAYLDTNLGKSGFFARMGMPPSSARSSASRDRGYEGRGKESWRNEPYKPPATKEEAKAEEEKKKLAETKTTTTTAAGGGGTSAPSTTSAAGQVAASKALLTKPIQKKAIEDFISPLTGLVTDQDPAKTGVMSRFPADTKFSDLKSDSAARQIEFLLRATSPDSLGKDIEENSEQAFKALSADETQWKRALQARFSDRGLVDVLGTNDVFGAKNTDDLVAAVRPRAKHALDAVLATRGFDNATPENIMAISGLSLDFPEITSAATADELTAKFADPDIGALMPLVAELGSDSKGNSTSLTDAGEKMTTLLEGFNAIEKHRKTLETNATARASDVDTQMGQMGLKPEFLTLSALDKPAIARMLDLPGATGHHSDEVPKEAEKWQRARTVLEVARVHDLVKEGGAFPKVWSALVPAWVKANQAPGWAPRVEKALSSLPLAVLSPAHPLARRVAVRKALGLELVTPIR